MRAASIVLVTMCLAASLTAQAKEAPTPAKEAKGAVSFEKDIWPIFEKKCIECHATAHAGTDGKVKKPKGGVTLDTKDGINGSKKGKVVVGKKPDDSLLYAAITLAADHEDRMPPAKKGDPLPKEEIELIKKWIESGAEFGTWTGKKADDKGKDKPKAGEPGKGKEKDKPEPKPAGGGGD